MRGSRMGGQGGGVVPGRVPNPDGAAGLCLLLLVLFFNVSPGKDMNRNLEEQLPDGISHRSQWHKEGLYELPQATKTKYPKLSGFKQQK